MLDLGRLAALVAVSDAGSITRGAARLKFTAPALSQQLSKLESTLGTQLLIRKSTGCELTTAGQVLVQHARVIFECVAEAEEDLARLSDLHTERCVIGSFATAGVHLVPPVLAEFQRLLPGIRVELQELEPPEGLRALGAGEIDFTVSHIYSHGPEPVQPEGVVEEAIITEEILVVAGNRMSLAYVPDSCGWRDLVGQPLICGRAGLADRDALEAVFTELELGTPTVTHETSNYDIACRLAEENLGIALVPRMALLRPAGALSVRSLNKPGFHRTITIAWRDRYQTAAVMALRRLFKRVGGRGP